MSKRLLRRALRYSVWELLFTLLYNLTLKRVLVMGLAVTAVLGLWRLEAPAVARDMVVAVYANHKAGDPVPFGPDYTMTMPYPSYATYGITVNSLWLANRTTNVVPYFAYDGLTASPNYPVGAFFFPRTGLSSFTVGGQAQTENGSLTINERYLTDPRWIDEAGALGTLVHELIHLQGGNFAPADGSNYFSGPEESAEKESNTSAATAEILAAMCNYQDEVACSAFWQEIEGFALAGLNTRLSEPVYDLFRSAFLIDADEEQADRKTDRFWARNERDRLEIRMKYGRHPWEAHVLPGLVHGQTLDTGMTYMTAGGHPIRLRMPFDDTFDIFGWRLGLFVQIMTLAAGG